MTQKAVAYQTNTDRMIKLNNDTRDLYALVRSIGSIKTFSTRSAGGESISPAGPSAGNFLPISGGTMIGAIGFHPVLVQTLDGHINISRSSEQEADFSTYVLVTGEGSPDDLNWIDGAAFLGQYLILQGTPTQILNLIHADNPGTNGNILTPNGQTVVMDSTMGVNGLAFVTLIFDPTVGGVGSWRVVSTSSGSGSVTGNINLNCEFGLTNTLFINFCTPLQYIRSFDDTLVIAVDDDNQSLILQTQGTPKITILNDTVTMKADLIMKTWDIKEVDRLAFKFDSGGVLGINTPEIYISKPDSLEHLTYNSSIGSHIWTNQNLVSMQVDHTTLIKQTEQLGGNVFDMFALYQPAPETIISVTDVSALRTGLQKTQFTRIATLVNDTFENNYSGSLIFQCFRTSPNPTTFFKLNENNDNMMRMFKELDMFTHDIQRVDRLRFGVGGSQTPINDFDNTIYGDNLFNQNYNTAQNAHYFWHFNNRVAMSFGHDDAMNNVLSVRGDEININTKPIISMEDIHESAIVGQAIGKINWAGTKEGGGAGLVEYADILVRYENRSQNDYSGSIQFGAYRGGSPIVWMDYNLDDFGYIQTHANIHLNAKDLLFQVDVATGDNPTGFKNLGDTVIALSSGSEIWRFIPDLFRLSAQVDLQDHYMDIDEWPGLPDIPAVKTRRLFVNGANDELSVRRSDGTVISLEEAGSGLQDPLILGSLDLGNLGSAQNIDWSLKNHQHGILDQNCVITMINLSAINKYEPVILQFKQDGTGGRSVTFADSFVNGGVPQIDPTANAYTTVVFYTDGNQDIHAFSTTNTTSLPHNMSDENTALPSASTTVPLATFWTDFAFLITKVVLTVTTQPAGGGASLEVDVHLNGTTIFSGKPTIDDGEHTSETGGGYTVITPQLGFNDKIELFLDVRDAGNVATGLKCKLIGIQN